MAKPLSLSRLTLRILQVSPVPLTADQIARVIRDMGWGYYAPGQVGGALASLSMRGLADKKKQWLKTFKRFGRQVFRDSLTTWAAASREKDHG